MPEKTQKYAVVWALPDGRIEYPDADDISYDDDGYLTIGRRLVAQGVFVFGPHVETIAFWAPGTWERAEVAERIPDFELREGEPVAPAETEPDAGPGTFEVYEDIHGRFRFRLRDPNDFDAVILAQEYNERADVEAAICTDLTRLGDEAKRQRAIIDDNLHVGVELAAYLVRKGWTPPAHFAGRITE